MPVDDDTAMIAGREIHDFPKKTAALIDPAARDGKAVGTVVCKVTLFRPRGDLGRGEGRVS